MLDPVKNFAKVIVSTGYDALATSIVLQSGDGAKLPLPSSDGAFNLVWWNSTDYSDPTDDPNKEIIRCTSRSTDTLTVTRGQEGITATIKNTAGKTYQMILTFTKKAYDDIDNIKAPLRPVTAKTTLVDADEVTGNDSANSFSQIRTTWTNVKSFLKTYFDTIYAQLAGSISQAFQVSQLEIGHATDTTLTRVSGGVVSIEGNNIITANNQVTALAAASAGDKDKYLHANSSTGAIEWTTVTVGGSVWTLVPGSPTRTANTTFTVTGDYTALLTTGLVIKWTESSAVKVGMVLSSSYSNPNTTVTIIGDTMASIDSSSCKYFSGEAIVKRFAVAGTLGATGTDIMNAWYADYAYRVIGARPFVGTAGTTNSTTFDINKAGTTMFTTKPTIATTATTGTIFTADNGTSLAINDRVSVDLDAIQTTAAIDGYVDLYLLPTRVLQLT